MPNLSNQIECGGNNQGVLVWPGEMPGAHQNRSVTPAPQLDRGEEM